ncbi:hypothetical protein AsAng_0057960 [Aureispira anguillae]|uniref:Uncharacterized protein n=1 Tax=Aureispira anguillae TaxID=2864201 RepID=A0A915YKQ9_9BACT|nr:hypothetical protein AsAng_0057960 [Aureispira anguillae]
MILCLLQNGTETTKVSYNFAFKQEIVLFLVYNTSLFNNKRLLMLCY